MDGSYIRKTEAESVSADDELAGDPTEVEVFDRSKLIAELAALGTRVEEFDNCSDMELDHLLRGMKWLQRTIAPQPINNAVAPFSAVDKQVLKSLITSNGRISSLALSRQLEIPLTTVQRRRKRLESEYIEMYYVLQVEKLFWRRASLLISTEEGRTRVIGKELLGKSSIASVSTTIGEHTINLLAEVIFKDNAELLSIIEWVKAIEGIKEVIWTERVERIGQNKDKILEIINGQKDSKEAGLRQQ